MRNIKKFLVSLLLLLILFSATVITWLYSQVDSALPLLNGKATIFGLQQSVVVERDTQGIPTIKAKNRLDLAAATGFIHAQERFFQMDLLRRNSAGELSSLFGADALDYDQSIRKHRFRQRASAIVESLSAEQSTILTAYTKGVNEGLKTLNAVPFEYLLLQQNPVEWQEEDTVLTVLSMYLDLQYEEGQRERTLGVLKSTLSHDVFAFLNPKGSQWDAAIDGTTYIPSPLPTNPWPAATTAKTNNIKRSLSTKGDHLPGSNNWAVGGKISSTGSAIVANDMHLGIRVPNTWFRASFEYSSLKITGLTLPGTPLMVTGSNGNIAWGFTNSYGDWSDVIVLETNEDKSQYKTPDGYRDFTHFEHVIAVKGESSESFTNKETIWGPVIGEDTDGNLLAYRWVAHDKNAVNLNALKLESTKTVKQAFTIAAISGIPAQNMMVGDRKGNIGWTIMGAIPTRSKSFGEVPTSWANGDNQWTGYLAPKDYPKVYNPDHNRLWTGNSRVIGEEMLDIVGNGGYALGARSKQIRDGLFAKDYFNEHALLDIALDDRALFLKRWQNFINQEVLTQEALAKYPQWQEAKKLLMDNNLAAKVDSVAYRLVRNFRYKLRDRVFEQLNGNLSKLDEGYDFSTIRHQSETPLWELVTKQPDNFLWRVDETWQATFLYAFEQTYREMTDNQNLSDATWGQQNTSNIRHPITYGVPFLGKWLNMPATQLAGDSYMPRVQGTAFGASERMIVSPGYEESGILHMPTSQAGHPWSPYFGKGHQDWEQGKPSPFLPGKTAYTLTLLSY